ncbi:sporulation protein [Brevibacillus sp. SYSU BS000544]|uniref:sporulation protein n=1 Tax=Brevibacillus sp. SYSU BS000544 TaxID=3416443 RepID=UPI003CE487AA
MRKIKASKNRVLSVGLAVCLLTVVTGCNSTSTPDARSSGVRSLDQTQTLPLLPDGNNDVIDRERHRMEDRDKLMGRNDNPNLVIGHQDVQNIGNDTRNMQMMAKSVPGVENARISIDGGNAFVTLDLVPNVTAGQARNIEQQVIRALSQKSPRYDFHITSNDGYHRR